MFVSRTLQRFDLRPHGLIEVLPGGTPFCFPTVLPRHVSACMLGFFNLLIPLGHSDLRCRFELNGKLLDNELVECLSGFFIQAIVTGDSGTTEDLLIVAPLSVRAPTLPEGCSTMLGCHHVPTLENSRVTYNAF